MLGARRGHRNHRFHAELGDFLDHPFEAVELDQSRQNHERRQRLTGIERIHDAELDDARIGGNDLRQAERFAISDLVLLAGLGAEHAGEVVGVGSMKRGAIALDAIDEEAAAGHVQCLRYFMIALLRGVLVEKHPNHVIVDAGGVGYEVNVPVSTFSHLPETGAEVRLRIHTHVREDALQLFGFATADEKNLFEKLIGVSGIGPKLGITILSGLAAPELILAIRTGQLEKLVRIPGIGKKTAERLVLELRDKMPAPAGEQPAAAAPALSAIDEDVLSALMNLGSPRPAAEAAIKKAKASGELKEFEPLFRRSLELLR